MPVSSSVADLDFKIFKNLWPGPKEPLVFTFRLL
jgi:hypothetical protein